MQDKPSTGVRPLLLNVLLWVGGVSVLLMIKDAVAQLTGPLGDSSMDLVTVLMAYLLLFLLEPIRNAIQRRLRKNARRRYRSRA
ncbi:hypothetical protein PSH87_15260 [Pseudomonas sp. FP453]|uniref:hypothetical protein n=1 Tax=unclassified Pseudomonas TaxID=196821 RepID=UPI00034740E5|nr:MULTISPECIES: hypothetical protein [unclassified Pseudomonas]WLH88034.1 hypothetical protein PSH87_15260 [Pseudomonas sp. FP453]